MIQEKIGKERVDLKGLTPVEIDDFCVKHLGQKPGQGTRAAIWLYRRRASDFDEMADLNRPFREQLKKYCTISSLIVEQRFAAQDGTSKILYRLADGNTVEGVLIPGPVGRLTLCVSSQVGCAFGCNFCFTGGKGLIRNLSVPEIINQVFAAQKTTDSLIKNVVLMGTGEPLSNYETIKSFVEILTGQSGMGYSPKKVTISTCGLAPAIERMACEINVNLAVSLNAATDHIRERIMPINKSYPLARLMQALRRYCDITGKTVTIEYVVLKGVNDTDNDAHRLMEVLKGLPCMVNILMFNPFPGTVFERPAENRVYAFRNILLNHGFVAVVRNSRGQDIHAACGQLRSTVESP